MVEPLPDGDEIRRRAKAFQVPVPKTFFYSSQKLRQHKLERWCVASFLIFAKGKWHALIVEHWKGRLYLLMQMLKKLAR
jgi:hypothetical protein